MASDDMEKCSEMLENLLAHAESEPFREPVLWEQWGLADYPLVVKNPMDLGTIKGKLEKKAYESATDFVQDVNLVWANCMLYNADRSPYWKLAKKFQKLFEKQVNKALGGADGEGGSGGKNKAPTPEEKAKFCRNIYNISPQQLGRILQQLDEKCVRALDKSNPNEIELNIDAIDGETFRSLEEFVKDCLSKKASSDAAKAKKRKLGEGGASQVGSAAVSHEEPDAKKTK